MSELESKSPAGQPLAADEARLEALLARWQDDSLTPAELDELTEALGDPAARRALVDDFQFAAAVSAALGEAPARQSQTLQLARSHKSRRFKLHWIIPAAAAACIAVAAGVWMLSRDGRTTSPAPTNPNVAAAPKVPASQPSAVIARLVETGGVVAVLSSENSAPFPAASAQVIYAGQSVRTSGDDSYAVIEYADGTRLLLGAETTVRLDERHAATPPASGSGAFGKQAILSAGILRAEVAKQPTGRPMLLVTPQAEVRVLGTKFTSAITPQATRIDLDEGTLELVRTADRQSIEMAQGMFAVATSAPSDATLAAQPLPQYITEPRFTFDRRNNAEGVALSPDGTMLAIGRTAGGGVKVIELWEMANTPHLKATLPTGRPAVRSLGFSPDGQKLAAGYKDSFLDLWDLRTQQCVKTWNVAELQPSSVAFSADGEWLAAALERPNMTPWGVRVWSTSTGVEAPAPPMQSRLRPVISLPTANLLAAGERNGKVVLWEPGSDQETGIFEGLPKPGGLAASKDGGSIAVATDDRVLVLGGKSGQLRQTLTEIGRKFRCVSVSPDGSQVAGGANDGTVVVWRVADGEPVIRYRGDNYGIRWVVFTPDGKTLISGAFSRPIRLWNLPQSGGSVDAGSAAIH